MRIRSTTQKPRTQAVQSPNRSTLRTHLDIRFDAEQHKKKRALIQREEEAYGAFVSTAFRLTLNEPQTAHFLSHFLKNNLHSVPLNEPINESHSKHYKNENESTKNYFAFFRLYISLHLVLDVLPDSLLFVYCCCCYCCNCCDCFIFCSFAFKFYAIL